MAQVKFSALLPASLATKLGLGASAPSGTANLTANQLAGLVVDNARKLAAAVIGPTVKEGGAAARMGVTTLVSGAKVINTTAVTANSRIFVGVQSLGTVTTPKTVARPAPASRSPRPTTPTPPWSPGRSSSRRADPRPRPRIPPRGTTTMADLSMSDVSQIVGALYLENVALRRANADLQQEAPAAEPPTDSVPAADAT
jgi:hypothetical protein